MGKAPTTEATKEPALREEKAARNNFKVGVEHPGGVSIRAHEGWAKVVTEGGGGSRGGGRCPQAIDQGGFSWRCPQAIDQGGFS